MDMLTDRRKKTVFLLFFILLPLLTGCQADWKLPEGWIPESEESSTAIILSGERTEAGTVNDDSRDETSVGAGGQTDMIYVHVCGCVKNPGVYALPAGSRAQDAVDAAGGFSKKADAAAWNLAALLEDGMQINIPAQSSGTDSMSGEGGAGTASSPGEAGDTGDQGRLLNINTASAQDFTSLPGIGESRARDIVSYRDENGLFGAIEDLKNVSGIGDGIFNKIKDLITI